MIAVVDSGYGNLRSVAKALARVGADVVVTGDPDVVRRADRVVMPGQGAFGDCVAALAGGLGDALREAIAAGRPYLGICLGLQVLFGASEESPGAAGLGLLAGRVVRFRRDRPAMKVPHMGWNRVFGRGDRLVDGVGDAPYFYFVHSYYAVPEDPDVVALECDYGVRFCAAVRRDNVFACQFHPEKSQRAGLRLLANFVEAP
ncbi:MAG: imidazole glycerol phosphate synthase subunit HisH [Deltaproteobacteria bacterium]|nr:MAG: imidazole glycerol phosphate synthase subunit HisH [Deltaproteobacteria bacterium]